jgi:hypothetical protein
VKPVSDPWRGWIPPDPQWDAVLRLAPSHIFILDSTLVCRYAAPLGDAFLGQTAEQLTGRHVSEILPPAANGLRPMLERAAQEGSRWSTPLYRYSHGDREAQTAYLWAIEVDPLAVADQRGVLVTLRDVPELVEERDLLRSANAGLAEQVRQLTTLNEQREGELAATGARLRTLLTSTWGYLQILARQPESIDGHSVTEMLETLILPSLREVIQVVNDLEHFPRDEP